MSSISSLNQFDPADDNNGQIVSPDAYEGNTVSKQDIGNNIMQQIGGGKAYGFNLSDVVSALVDGDMMDTIPDLQRQITNTNVRISAVSKLESLMSQLQTTTLSPVESGMSPYVIQSSNSADVSVSNGSGSSTPFVQPFTVSITSIAQADSWVMSQPQTTATTAIAGSGDVKISLASGTQTTITIAANSSLTNIADEINASNAGVQASVVHQNDGYHLAITSNSAGAANVVSFDATGLTNPSTLRSLFTQASATHAQTAADASYSINGIAMTSATNTVTYNNVLLNLNKNGGSATINTTTNTTNEMQSIQEFVSNYNELLTSINQLNSATPGKQYQGSLHKDVDLKTVMSNFQTTIMSGLANGYSLNNAGISFNPDGTIALNQSRLSQALLTDPGLGTKIFATTMTATNNSIQAINFSKTANSLTGMPVTQSGTYDINITNAATAAHFQSANAMTINGDDTITLGSAVTLDISVSGETNIGGFDGQKQTADIPINIPSATYTQTDLAQLIQSAINNNATVSKNNGQVSVSISGGHLVINSNNKGSLNGFQINSGTSTNVNLLGISNSDMSSTYFGDNVSGTINGQLCFGDGEYLQAQPDAGVSSAAAGLTIKVSGSQTGNMGSVTLSAGYGQQLDTLISQLTSYNALQPESSGLLARKLYDYQQEVNQSNLNSLMSKLKTAKAKKEQLTKMYFKKYEDINAILSKLNSEQNYISAMMNADSNSDNN